MFGLEAEHRCSQAQRNSRQETACQRQGAGAQCLPLMMNEGEGIAAGAHVRRRVLTRRPRQAAMRRARGQTCQLSLPLPNLGREELREECR